MIATTTCIDCGQTVPTIRTGEGWFDLPRCPSATASQRQTHQDGHRVSRDDFEAAQADKCRRQGCYEPALSPGMACFSHSLEGMFR